MKKALSLDAVERILAIAFVSSMVWRIFSAVINGDAPWVAALVCFGEILALFFLLIRRPSDKVTAETSDWILAFAATILPTLVNGGGDPLIAPWIAGIMFIVATIAQFATKLSLNRSFGIVPANRGVVTSGFYAWVRHPVYASYLLGHIAFLLLSPTLWNVVIYSGAWALQIMRVFKEERFLAQDAAYRAYQQTVRYRLVPGIF